MRIVKHLLLKKYAIAITVLNKNKKTQNSMRFKSTKLKPFTAIYKLVNFDYLLFSTNPICATYIRIITNHAF